MSKRLNISDEQLEKIAKALADSNRVKILRQVGSQHRVPLSDVLERLAISGATLSHHIRALEATGLIVISREQNSAFLTIRREIVSAYAARP